MPGNYVPQGYPAQGPQPYPPQGYPNQPQQPQKYNASYEHSDGFQTCVAVTVTIAFAVFSLVSDLDLKCFLEVK